MIAINILGYPRFSRTTFDYVDFLREYGLSFCSVSVNYFKVRKKLPKHSNAVQSLETRWQESDFIVPYNV